VPGTLAARTIADWTGLKQTFLNRDSLQSGKAAKIASATVAATVFFVW